MKQTNISVEYDAEADLLEIVVGEPAPAVFDEIEDDVFEGRDEQTNELRGYKIFNIRQRSGSDRIFLRALTSDDEPSAA